MSVGTDDGWWREHWKNHQSGAVLFLTFRHGVSKNDLALSQRNLILAFSSTYMVGLGGGGCAIFSMGRAKNMDRSGEGAKRWLSGEEEISDCGEPLVGFSDQRFFMHRRQKEVYSSTYSPSRALPVHMPTTLQRYAVEPQDLHCLTCTFDLGSTSW